MFEVTIIDFGDVTKAARKLHKGAKATLDTEGVMWDVYQDMMRIERIIFESEGRRGGGSWKAVKPDTARRKGTTKILQTEGARSGYGSGANALMRSLTEEGAEYQELFIDKEILEFGTSRPAAGVHLVGAPSRNIPARPFMNFTNRDVERWSDWFMEHMMAGFADA